MKHTLTITIVLAMALGLTGCKQEQQTQTPYERAAADEAFIRQEVEAFLDMVMDDINAQAAQMGGRIQHFSGPLTLAQGADPIPVNFLSQLEFGYEVLDIPVVGYGEILSEPFHAIAEVQVTVTRRTAGMVAPPLLGTKASRPSIPLPLFNSDWVLPAEEAALTDEQRMLQSNLMMAPEETLTDTFLVGLTYIASDGAWRITDTNFPPSWVFIPSGPLGAPQPDVPTDVEIPVAPAE